MWIARGHQRPHANVTPSSFVEPNVPFRMCHETSASQFPVVGSASKLHGHPHAQLQLWIYSASKFHFVGIDRTHLAQVRIGSRLLNRRTEGPPVAPVPHVPIGTSPSARGMVDTGTTKPADDTATALFIAPYFLVWGAFGVAALLALSALGLMGAMTGPLAFASAVTLVAAGLWQVTRTKEVCLTHCTSPMSFVLHHWR